MNLHEQQELETVLRRFGALPTRAQLEAYEFIRDYLGESVKQTKADREVSERKEAVEALRQVAEELGLPDGQAPTSPQFDKAAKRLGLGWSASRVVRAWGKWRFACEAFTGHHVRRSARQRALLEAKTGKRRRYENHLTAIRLWLDTDPPLEEITAYDTWSREFNDDLPDGQPPVALWNAIQVSLRISFADAIRVARGELTLEDCPRKVTDHLSDYGPLVSTNWIAGERDLPHERARYYTYRRDFPKPVVNLSRNRAWLKDDVVAYFAREPFPEREEFALQDEFLSAAELAEMIGSPTAKFSQTMRIPEPAGRVSQRRYWRRSEVERWLRAEASRAQRRRRTPPAAARR